MYYNLNYQTIALKLNKCFMGPDAPIKNLQFIENSVCYNLYKYDLS